VNHRCGTERGLLTLAKGFAVAAALSWSGCITEEHPAEGASVSTGSVGASMLQFSESTWEARVTDEFCGAVLQGRAVIICDRTADGLQVHSLNGGEGTLLPERSLDAATALFGWHGDSLALFRGRAEVVLLDPAGREGRRMQFELPPNGLPAQSPYVLFSDGSSLVYRYLLDLPPLRLRSVIKEGPFTGEASLVRVAAEGWRVLLVTPIVHTFTVMTERSSLTDTPAGAPRAIMAGAGEIVVWADGSHDLLVVKNIFTGALDSLRLLGDPPPRRQVGAIVVHDSTDLRARLDALASAYEFEPWITGIFVDRQSRIWVGRYASDDAEARTWEIFENATVVAQVQLPTRFDLVLDSTDEFVLVRSSRGTLAVFESSGR